MVQQHGTCRQAPCLFEVAGMLGQHGFSLRLGRKGSVHASCSRFTQEYAACYRAEAYIRSTGWSVRLSKSQVHFSRGKRSWLWWGAVVHRMRCLGGVVGLCLRDVHLFFAKCPDSSCQECSKHRPWLLFLWRCFDLSSKPGQPLQISSRGSISKFISYAVEMGNNHVGCPLLPQFSAAHSQMQSLQHSSMCTIIRQDLGTAECINAQMKLVFGGCWVT